MNQSTKASNIDHYISRFEKDVQEKLEQMRNAIFQAAPEAKEMISYDIPTFVLNGNLVHFAAFKNHIGFYPGPSGIKAYEEELSGFKGAKGSVQFPFDRPLPLETVGKIVRFRVEENLRKKGARS